VTASLVIYPHQRNVPGVVLCSSFHLDEMLWNWFLKLSFGLTDESPLIIHKTEISTKILGRDTHCIVQCV